MSKIGNLQIVIPQGVNVTQVDNDVSVAGPKGNLSFNVHPQIKVQIEGDKIRVTRKSETKFAKSLHGLTRSIIANMVKGVVDGHEKVLEVIGVGYRAAKQGDDLVLNVGYSHPVVIAPLNGVQLDAKENKIVVTGADKVVVGEMAARIRRVRPPEPYKGKGIKYFGEVIRRKAGKAVKAAGGGA
ncbi:MAG: 50S ribosomal protein L6 [Candidatus Curtissbacteria bacterium]